MQFTVYIFSLFVIDLYKGDRYKKAPYFRGLRNIEGQGIAVRFT